MKKAPRWVDRQELQQEAWLGLLQSLERWDGKRQLANFSSKRIAGAIVDFLRKEWEHHGLAEAQDIAGTDYDPLAVAMIEEHRRILCCAISMLSQQQRRVVQLRYYDGLNARETGEKMGFCESRTSQIHTQALRCLRAQMDGQYEKIFPIKFDRINRLEHVNAVAEPNRRSKARFV